MAKRTEPYAGPFPRSKHSHRCNTCNEASYCYKQQCAKPQLTESCPSCTHRSGLKPVPSTVKCSNCLEQVPTTEAVRQDIGERSFNFHATCHSKLFGAPVPAEPFLVWLAAVDAEMQRLYAITMTELEGADAPRLRSWFAAGDDPKETAEEYGEEYELIRADFYKSGI